MQIKTIRTNAELIALDVSYYTLCRLSDAIMMANPRHGLEDYLARNPEVKGELVMDYLGNFIDFR